MATADSLAADLIREKYDYYLNLGQPIEDTIISELFSPEEMTRQVMEAKGYVQGGFEAGRAGTADYRSRYGTVASAQDLKLEERRSQIREELAKQEAGDTVRGMVSDRDMNTAMAMSKIGQGMAANAQAGLTSAANTQAQLDAYNEQVKASNTANTIGLIGSGAGVGFMVGGPVGAGVGALVGAGMSLF